MRARAPEDARTSLGALMLRARGELQWLSAAPFDAARADAITAEDAEEISDHADEAEEALVEVLLVLRPDLPALEESGSLQTPVPRRPKPRGKKAKAILLRAVEDISVLLQADVQGAISDAYQQATQEEKGAFERMSEAVEYASNSIEAALLALEPDYFKQELAFERDPDERIAKAAHLESIEARRAEVRQTNDFSRLVSDASKKIHALEEANGATAALVSRLISAVTEDNAESTIHQLVEAAGLSEDEARAIVGFYLVPQRLS